MKYLFIILTLLTLAGVAQADNMTIAKCQNQCTDCTQQCVLNPSTFCLEDCEKQRRSCCKSCGVKGRGFACSCSDWGPK